jgi:nickel transport protein
MKRIAAYVGTLLVCTLLLAGSLHAHNVIIFAWVEGDRVYTESKFSGGRKAKNAAVEVYDTDGTKLLEGKTDENGEFDFKIPQKTELKVVLNAGMGHRGEWTIPLDEIAPGMSPQPAPDTPVETEPQKTSDRQQVVRSPGPTLKEVQAAVETALDKKLKPLFKLVAESRQQGPSASDILGGIGYIAGLVGVGAYVSSRKKNGGDRRG